MALVTLQYSDLLAGKDLSEELYRAYGPDGLGALSVAGIPQYVEQRQQLLPLSHALAHQPADVLTALEDDESLWNAGWSYGREMFGGQVDQSKGSFYANPLYDVAVPEAVREQHPYSYPHNRWPQQALPALEPAFKTLGKTMFDVIVLLCQQIDALMKKRNPAYTADLSKHISNTRKLKGRLLYYFPTDDQRADSWIGWHNDSGFLTALTSALFFDDDTGEVIANPDPEGGLYVVTRGGDPVRVRVPADHLAIQCGEALQVVTGGLLVATPHAVRASKAPAGKRVGRGTFPIFIDTDVDFPLSAPVGTSREAVFDKTPDSRVPPLSDRWTEDGMPFGKFLSDSFKLFYSWNNPTK
eukprot:TRINITY_DN811_c0_g1_i1.p1 TRINITY_DN811_c0_g1~~TRINITY_DN811_c0_g1_i1.p1  ORF type:complete len:368 (+),score=44.68 TRINITY_DN811_c0_g1_i1:42-1106(+)